MAATPRKGTETNGDRKKWLTILVPAAGIAVLVVLVAVMAGIGGTDKKMSDGSDGSADDSELKELTPGVKYRDLKVGTGDPAPNSAKVKINYTGWLTDGTVFDSTKDKTPAVFELNNLIVGWQEGIPGMKPGSIRKLVIAPEKAYKAHAKPKIPANSTLIFEIELIEVIPTQVMLLKADAKTLSDGKDPNAEDPDLKDIGEGLKIRDIKEGTGATATEDDRVEVYYTGWLTNGTVFDSSAQKGETIAFGLNSVIQGWKKGIAGMKVGGVRKLVIPASLGYKDKSAGKIPPNSMLIFEVQLTGIK